MSPCKKDAAIDITIYAIRGAKSMGRPDVFSLLVMIRKGATIGSINLPKKVLIGCIGSSTQDKRELIIIAQDKILKNHTKLIIICRNIILCPNKLMPPNLLSFY